MDPDLNKYDLHHRVTHHSKMSDAEWEEAYHGAWKSYYSDEHLETIARRHGATKKRNFARVLQFLTEFRVLYELEGIHPLEGGIIRLKFRKDRRPGRPREWPGIFHLKLASEVVWKVWHYARYSLKAAWIARKVKLDPKRFDYMDTAITAATESEQDALTMFTETLGGRGAVEKKRAADCRRELFAPSVKKALSADG